MAAKKQNEYLLTQRAPGGNLGKHVERQQQKQQLSQPTRKGPYQQLEAGRSGQQAPQAGGAPLSGELSPQDKHQQEEEYLKGAGAKVDPQEEAQIQQQLQQQQAEEMMFATAAIDDAGNVIKAQKEKEPSDEGGMFKFTFKDMMQLFLSGLHTFLSLIMKIPVVGWVLAILLAPINFLIWIFKFIIAMLDKPRKFKIWLKTQPFIFFLDLIIPASILGFFATKAATIIAEEKIKPKGE